MLPVQNRYFILLFLVVQGWEYIGVHIERAQAVINANKAFLFLFIRGSGGGVSGWSRGCFVDRQFVDARQHFCGVHHTLILLFSRLKAG